MPHFEEIVKIFQIETVYLQFKFVFFFFSYWIQVSKQPMKVTSESTWDNEY